MRLTVNCFSLNLKQDLTVRALRESIQFLHVWLAHIVSTCWGDREITRKYRNSEAPRNTRKVWVAAQAQCWWDAETHTPKQCTNYSFSWSPSYKSVKQL